MIKVKFTHPPGYIKTFFASSFKRPITDFWNVDSGFQTGQFIQEMLKDFNATESTIWDAVAAQYNESAADAVSMAIWYETELVLEQTGHNLDFVGRRKIDQS